MLQLVLVLKTLDNDLLFNNSICSPYLCNSIAKGLAYDFFKLLSVYACNDIY